MFNLSVAFSVVVRSEVFSCYYHLTSQRREGSIKKEYMWGNAIISPKTLSVLYWFLYNFLFKLAINGVKSN